MFEICRWYERNPKHNIGFERPTKYMKYLKGNAYYIIALYSIVSIELPAVSLLGPFEDEQDCDSLMSQLIMP